MSIRRGIVWVIFCMHASMYPTIPQNNTRIEKYTEYETSCYVDNPAQPIPCEDATYDFVDTNTTWYERWWYQCKVNMLAAKMWVTRLLYWKTK